jgi:hypothetical protein
MTDLISSLVGRRSRCDTDFYELLAISGSENFDETQAKTVLRETFKGAVSKNPKFDFESCTLKLITTKAGLKSNVDCVERKFLLLHTQVYGGSKSPEEHIDNLLEADKITNENLREVLDKKGILSDVIFKQYIYYSENIDKFRGILKNKMPGLVRTEIDDQSEMYIGKFHITAISTAKRNISSKLGFIAEDLAHELLNYQNITQESLKSAANLVLSRIERIESIQRVAIHKVYLTSILPAAVMIAAIIFVFIIYIHLYWRDFINDQISLLAIVSIFISIIGMAISLAYSFLDKKNFIIKR